MKKLKIEYIALDELKPYEKNARKHEAEDLKTIKNSIDAFGMCDPIGIWSKNNIIVEGHGRLLALKELGYTEAPCIRLDHLTDEERRAYTLAHNKTAEMSSWDFAKLNAELEELAVSELDLDMSDVGFIDVADIDIDKFFADDEIKRNDEKKAKEIQCPCCGEFFTVD